MFNDKINKVSLEINNLEKKIKQFKEKRDQSEVRIDQCKRDCEDLKSKI